MGGGPNVTNTAACTGGHSLVISREPPRANKQGSDLISLCFRKRSSVTVKMHRREREWEQGAAGRLCNNPFRRWEIRESEKIAVKMEKSRWI